MHGECSLTVWWLTKISNSFFIHTLFQEPTNKSLYRWGWRLVKRSQWFIVTKNLGIRTNLCQQVSKQSQRMLPQSPSHKYGRVSLKFIKANTHLHAAICIRPAACKLWGIHSIILFCAIVLSILMFDLKTDSYLYTSASTLWRRSWGLCLA